MNMHLSDNIATVHDTTVTTPGTTSPSTSPASQSMLMHMDATMPQAIKSNIPSIFTPTSFWSALNTITGTAVGQQAAGVANSRTVTGLESTQIAMMLKPQ
eukprot:GFYU01000350.1.p2 GENE.GFYU01000350.1~~GFYU01000350.1.p2  ORF type:complete len:100 (-),score=31.44 GFYU01000350.1:43-342(-)